MGQGRSKLQKILRFPARRLAAWSAVVFIVLNVLAMTGCRGGKTGNETKPVTITFAGWGPGSSTELQTGKALLADFTKKTGIQVNYIMGPESATDSLRVYLQWLERKSSTPDVFYTDVIWPGLVSEHMIDLKPYLGEEAEKLWPAAVQNDIVSGKLVAMPYDAEIGVLYYRTDLLNKYGYKRPPESWDDLAKMAAQIQAGERAAGHLNFWGFVWQGAPYEGLTCDALEWQASYGGGKIVEDNGIISVNNPQTLKAMKMARSWVGTISPPSVLSYMENDGRNLWDSGNAAFLRDWVWRGTPEGKRLSASPHGVFNISPLPSGGARHASVFGGQSLAVSKYSEHPREASEFVRYLTSREVQLRLWQEQSTLPAIREFYENPEYLAASPDLEQLKSLLTGGAIDRPSAITGKQYPEVSRAYFTAVHSILTGETTAEKAMANLESELVRMTGFKPGKPN